MSLIFVLLLQQLSLPSDSFKTSKATSALAARDEVTWEARSSDVRSADCGIRGRRPNPSFRRPSFRSLSPVFFANSLQLFADFLAQHGESVTGDPAAAAGREESGREGGRSPQTWVEDSAWEPAAAAPARIEADKMKYRSALITEQWMGKKKIINMLS